MYGAQIPRSLREVGAPPEAAQAQQQGGLLPQNPLLEAARSYQYNEEANNPRSGMAFRQVQQGGHTVHVYANGQKVVVPGHAKDLHTGPWGEHIAALRHAGEEAQRRQELLNEMQGR